MSDRPDPLGLRARIKALGYTQSSFGARHRVSPNTLTRAIKGEPSDTLDRIRDILDREESAGPPAPAQSWRREVMERALSGMELADLRIVPVEVDGVMFFTATVRDPSVSDEDARNAVRDYMRRQGG